MLCLLLHLGKKKDTERQREGARKLHLILHAIANPRLSLVFFSFSASFDPLFSHMADSPQEAPEATVHIRCTNGSKFSVQARLSITVAAFKTLLVHGSGVSADQQRLIYKGRVLKDDSSLESYGKANSFLK